MDEAEETAPIADIYADGVADVELLGDGENIRITFFTWSRGQKIVVCKLVRPTSSYLTTDMFRVMIENRRRSSTATTH